MLLSYCRLKHHCPEMKLTFALCVKGRLWDEFVILGQDVAFLDRPRFSRPWTVLASRSRLRDHLKASKPDVVMTHSAWLHAVFAPVCRDVGVPTLSWLHNRTEGRHWSERLARRCPPLGVIAVSEDTRRFVPQLFPEVPSRVVHSPLPVDEKLFEKNDRQGVRQALGIRESDLVIIQVSRMEAWKGHRIHLRALAKLMDLPNWSCLMVGGYERPEEKDYYDSLLAETERLGLRERVKFLGKRRDVPQLLSASDLFCQPNLEAEGLGLVFVEAAVGGLPVITSGIGGAAELFGDGSALLTSPGRVDDVASAIRRLLENQQERLKRGALCRARVLEFCSPERQVKRLYQVATDLLSGNK